MFGWFKRLSDENIRGPKQGWISAVTYRGETHEFEKPLTFYRALAEASRLSSLKS